MNSVVSLMRKYRQKEAYTPPKAIPRMQPPANRMPVAKTQQVPNQGNTAQRHVAGSPHVLGSGVPQTGIFSQKTDATPLPGAPGSVASNPIDNYGALGPQGTVDGNHARGLAKGFKIG